MAKAYCCTAVHSKHCCEKTSEHLSLYASIFSFLPAVSSFSTLSTYCWWCGLDVAFLISFLTCWLLCLGQLWNVFQTFLFLSSPCVFANCHVSKEFLIPDLDDNLHYQMWADTFIIAPKMWCVACGVFFPLPCLPGHPTSPLNLSPPLPPLQLFMGHSPPLYSELSFITAHAVSNLAYLSLSHRLCF